MIISARQETTDIKLVENISTIYRSKAKLRMAIRTDSFGNPFRRIFVGALTNAPDNWGPFWSAFFSTRIKYIHIDSHNHTRARGSRRITFPSSDIFSLSVHSTSYFVSIVEAEKPRYSQRLTMYSIVLFSLILN